MQNIYFSFKWENSCIVVSVVTWYLIPNRFFLSSAFWCMYYVHFTYSKRKTSRKQRKFSQRKICVENSIILFKRNRFAKLKMSVFKKKPRLNIHFYSFLAKQAKLYTNKGNSQRICATKLVSISIFTILYNLLYGVRW